MAYKALYRTYRPSNFDEIAGQEHITKTFRNALVKNKIAHAYLFSGPRGTGKTTIARALCSELGLDPLFINASESGGIDTIRTKIRQYASTVSIDGDDLKIVILDESDALTRSAQTALRGFIEEFSNNCRFIFTANYKNKIIDPIQSRLTIFDFVVSNKDKNLLN